MARLRDDGMPFAFATRRLVADSVAILFAVRESEAAASIRRELSAWSSAGSRLMRRGRLLACCDGQAVAPEVGERLWEATGGTRSHCSRSRRLLTDEQLLGREPPARARPAGATLERAFTRRADTLPADVAARAAGRRRLALDGARAGRRGAVGPGDRRRRARGGRGCAGLIAIADGRIDFRHPLVRSALFHGAAPSERRDAHRALADAMRDRNDPERWAWHLAWAALGADDEAAEALELAARQATARSSYAAAAAAMERAASLTADEERRLPRLYAAADAALHAGRRGGPIAPRRAAPGGRAAVPQGRGVEAPGTNRVPRRWPKRAGDLLMEASALLEDVDRRLAVEICTEACSARLGVGDAPGMLAAAERAHALAADTEDDDIRRRVSLTLGWVACYVGRSDEGTPLLEDAVESPAEVGAQLDSLSLLASASRSSGWSARGGVLLRRPRRRRGPRAGYGGPASLPALPAGLARQPRRSPERGVRGRVGGACARP